MKKDGSLPRLMARIPRSLAARKKNYTTKARAFFKQQRMMLKYIGKPLYYLWILGCQRSGTTLLERMFRNDLDSAVFGEFSQLTIGSDRTVLKPFSEVEKVIASCNARYAVIRPLFESDRVSEILGFFQPSTAIWVFRAPRDVVNSMVNKWGDLFFEISRQVEQDVNGKWRLEGLHKSIKEEAKCLTGTDEKIEDLYALYWLKRNEIIDEAALCHNNQILFLNYERLVSSPKLCADKIMKCLGVRGVWKYFSTDAHLRSLNRNITLTISPEIQEHCDILYNKLCGYGKRDFPEYI
ncbi:MAG: sulfotransferase [Desulfobacteraceae bacterium]|nr:sulfotransferase domain-containing protein [Desulfobacteraceae bacterium]MBC2757651.1 sulfotransferase [Desulfobacteraceae bacterium]MBC2763896.1 sulfotransferase [ANME-2 cluster archaeon]